MVMVQSLILRIQGLMVRILFSMVMMLGTMDKVDMVVVAVTQVMAILGRTMVIGTMVKLGMLTFLINIYQIVQAIIQNAKEKQKCGLVVSLVRRLVLQYVKFTQYMMKGQVIPNSLNLK